MSPERTIDEVADHGFAWLEELIRRIEDDPRLLDGCPGPVAQCIAELVIPTDEMPVRLGP